MMDIDNFNFPEQSFSEEDISNTTLDELRGSLPVYSPLRLTVEGTKRCDTPKETPCSKRPRQTAPMAKALSFGDVPVCHPSPSTDVQNAVNRLIDTDIRGDATAPCALPTVKGKHPDLKSINSQTLINLCSGAYPQIRNFKIIDCRYPYEFNGGHIQGAINMYRQSDIQQLLANNQNSPVPDVLIFHCEFSSERAPKLCRFLRNKDREVNSDRYPHLTYPELYILDGGYKAFYTSFQKHCQPMQYIPMLHQDHKDDIRHFRSKSKSWTAGEKRKSPQRLLF